MENYDTRLLEQIIKIKGLKIQEKKFCKKCCDAVVKGHFCYYCKSIYRDDMSDTSKWVECDFCKKWEHFDCELTKGKRYSTKQELEEVKQYMCPICVNERAEQKNIDSKIQKKLINKKRRGDEPLLFLFSILPFLILAGPQ